MNIRHDQVLKAEAQLIAAQISHDIAMLDVLIHDDLLFMGPDGQVYTKAMDLDAHRSGNMVIEKLQPLERQIQLHGDTATVVLTVTTKGAISDQPVQGKLRYIRVWKLYDKQPRIIAGSFIQLQ